jgi:hypothetical protein
MFGSKQPTGNDPSITLHIPTTGWDVETRLLFRDRYGLLVIGGGHGKVRVEIAADVWITTEV